MKVQMLLVAIVMFGLSGLSRAETSSSTKKPNIILIMADDIGVEWFTPYGSEENRTPNLDRLAAEGIRFDHCYAQPLCTPARIKLMTGKYNFRNYRHFGNFPEDEFDDSFGWMMKRAGYKTCMAGKWQLGPEHPGVLGFDSYLRYRVGQDPKINANYYWNPRDEMCQRITESGKSWQTKTESNYGPQIVNEFVKGFIEAYQDEPFFVYYPMLLCHEPHQPTPDSEDKDYLRLADQAYADGKWFPDQVSYMDKAVGNLVGHLESLGLRENTLLIFTGDNGSPYSIARYRGKSVQGNKGKLNDLGTHVPLICNWPGTIEPGTVSDDLIDFTDFLPTLADAANTSLPNNLDGISFLPQLKGKQGNPRDWAFVFYTPNQPSDKTVGYWARTQRWKLYHDGRLFDMENDPEEANPIMEGEGGEEAKQARSHLEAAFDDLGVTPQTLDDVKKRSKYADKYEYPYTPAAAIE